MSIDRPPDVPSRRPARQHRSVVRPLPVPPGLSPAVSPVEPELPRGVTVLASSAERGPARRRPVVLAGVHCARPSAEVVLAAVALAEAEGARLVVGVAEPSGLLNAWAATSCGHAGPLVHLQVEAVDRALVVAEQDALSLLSLAEAPWTVVRLPACSSVHALAALARCLTPRCVVLGASPRTAPWTWSARAARSLRSAPAPLLRC